MNSAHIAAMTLEELQEYAKSKQPAVVPCLTPGCPIKTKLGHCAKHQRVKCAFTTCNSKTANEFCGQHTPAALAARKERRQQNRQKVKVEKTTA